MSEGCENTLQFKDLSDLSNEHILPIILWILSVFLTELTDCASHQVGMVDLILVADGGHLFLEDFWKSQTGLVWVFLHRHFLSSFWILVIIRLTVSRMRFSFDLLDRGLFVRPHKGLSSDSCWSFFMGYSPVQQSLQEYLGVLVGNPMEP